MPSESALSMSEQDFTAWLAREQKSIGGSDIGAIVGTNPYKTAADVWDSIMGVVPRTEDNPNMARGRTLEATVATQYAHVTGRRVRNASSRRVGVYARVSVDRIILPVPERRGRGVLEIKVPRAQNYRTMALVGVDASYHAQLTWYMGWLGYHWGSFAIFNADDWVMFHHDVDFDRAQFERLQDAADRFWTQHVLTRERPVQVRLEEMAVAVDRVGGVALDVGSDDTWSRPLAALRRAQEQKKVAEHAWELAREEVEWLMTGAGADVVTGHGVTVRWNDVPATRFDQQAFRREHPDLFALYQRSTATRPFRVSSGTE